MNDKPAVAVQALSPGRTNPKEVKTFQRAFVKLHKVTHTGMRWGFFVLCAVVIAQAGALYHLIPLIRVVPVFIPVNSDDTLSSKVTPIRIDPSVTMDSLKGNRAATINALWQYTRLREKYDWAEANYAWDVVSAMSALDVRKQFQDWYIYTNKASPQVVYGFTGAIKVSYDDADLTSDRFSVTFWRQRFEAGQAVSKPELWVCNMAYATDYNTPLNARIQYNASGLVVTSYPGCTPKGAKPGGLTIGGTP